MIIYNNKELKNNIHVIKKQSEIQGIVIGTNTPLYTFFLNVLKMNMCNWNTKKYGVNINELFDKE